MKYLLLTLLFVSQAQAADKVLILNEQEQIAYREVMDSTIRAYGMLSQVGRNASVFLNRLDQAGVVTEQKPIPPEPKKEGDQ